MKIPRIEDWMDSGADPKACLASIMKAFGGYDGVAERLREDYDAAPAGSNQRVAIMRHIFQLVLKTEQVDHDGQTESEIDAELAKMMK